LKKKTATLEKGDIVLATDGDYRLLVGRVEDIAPLGSTKHQSGNSTDDIYVNFKTYEYSEERSGQIEEEFSALYGESKSFDDIPLDMVIMPPNHLLRISECSAETIRNMLEDKEYASVFAERHTAQIDRETKTHAMARASDVASKETSAKPEYRLAIDIRPIEPKGKLLGFANVTVNELITINDFKIVQGETDLIVCMPSKADSYSKTGYRNTVFINSEHRQTFCQKILDEYRGLMEKSQPEKAKPKTSGEKLSIADQLKAAQKEYSGQKAQGYHERANGRR